MNKTRLVTKTATKTNRFKTKQGFIPFEAYRARLIGKYNLTWAKSKDLILDVKLREYGLIDYVVERDNVEVLTHRTFISIEEVFK